MLPKADKAFMESNPTKDQIIERFGKPTETIGKGEQFKSSGWHPLPTERAQAYALAFVRQNGSKFYIYFSESDVVYHYVIAHS